MLELAAVLSLSAACAPTVAPQTLAAIAHVESGFDPLAIGVNRGGTPPRRARNAAEAVVIATRLIDRGANIDLGLAQINSANLHWLGMSVAEAFDPCRNLAAAGTVLQAGYRPSGDTPGRVRTRCGLPCPATTRAMPDAASGTATSARSSAPRCACPSRFLPRPIQTRSRL